MEMTLSVHDWTIIDASIDNIVDIAGQNGEEFTAEQGRAVLQADGVAARSHPRAGQGCGWRPEDENLSIELPGAMSQFVVGQLRRWDEVDALANPCVDGDPEPRFLELARRLEERIR